MKRILSVRNDLLSTGHQGLPALVSAFGDKTYSHVSGDVELIGFGGGVFETVGSTCRDIFLELVRCRTCGMCGERGGKLRGPNAYEEFFKKDYAKWWKKHRGKTLIELRIVHAEWTLANGACRPEETKAELAELRKGVYRKPKLTSSL
ncbi:MAG: hypothetical protein HRU16_03930 [Planctomycetes bacterium]|nr:hypothetical protein [Planctomycetota bacterium]